MNNVTVTFDKENEKIKISSISNTDIYIDCSGDVDFTELVSMLTKSIDDENEISLSTPDIDDEKLEMVIQTIEDIIDNYNNALNEEVDSELNNQTINESSDDDLDDDLPF